MLGVHRRDLTRKTRRVMTVLVVLLMQCMPGSVLAATPSTLPAPFPPSPNGALPVPRPLPAGFRFTATFLPTGFIESKTALATAFTFGTNASAAHEAPGFFRVWTRPTSDHKLDFIIVIAERTGRGDPSITPTSRRDARSDERIRPGRTVYVSTSQGWDVRWTERKIDVKVLVQAPTISPLDVEKFIAGIRLS